MNKELRLKKFYSELDELMGNEVGSIENAILDGCWNEKENRIYNNDDLRTFENFGNTIYKWIIEMNEDFKFLTKDFIMNEIEKYFNEDGYWSKIRDKYKLY